METESPGASLEQGCRPESGAVEALIARLSAATKPDRELDCAIDDWLCATRLSWPVEKAREIREKHERDYGRVEGRSDVAKFTSSFDAAMSLVPNGHDWIVGSVNGQVGGTPYACVGSQKEHYGETPILSLCIAALRATLAMKVGTPSSETLSR